MLHQTWAHTPHSRRRLPTALPQENCSLGTNCSARRSGNKSVCAGRQDAAAVISVAVYANGRFQSQAVAWTVEPPVSTEWVCPSVPQQHHAKSHIVPLHGQQTEDHLQLSLGPGLSIHNANVSRDLQEPCIDEAQHHTQTKQRTRCTSHVQQLQQPQPADVLGCLPTDSQVLSAAVDLQQRAELQKQECHRRQETQQQVWQKGQNRGRRQQHWLAQQRHQAKASSHAAVPPDPGPLLVRVANSTSAHGLAQQLVNRLHQQLKLQQRQQKHTSKQGASGMPDSSRSSISVALQCSSGISMYNALQAISLAAQQAACLQQPQQLLLQPQLVRNVLDTAADGKHRAGAYQLLLMWMPAATCPSTSSTTARVQQQPQQRCVNKQLNQSQQQHDNQQEQQHSPLQMSHSAELLGSSPPDSTAATVLPVSNSGTLHFGTQRSHLLQCDAPAAAARKQTKCKHKQRVNATCSSQQSSSSSPMPRRDLAAQSMSWRVSGLLRGGWPAELSCCSPAGALVAVKALVSARKQLAAGGMDLLVAVQTTACSVDPEAVQAAVEASTLLTAAGYTVQQPVAVARDAGPTSSSSRCSSSGLDSRRAEFVQTSAAEHYLRQQQQERSKHRELLSKLNLQQQQQQSTLQDTSSMCEGHQGHEGQQQQVQQPSVAAQTTGLSMQRQQQQQQQLEPSLQGTPVGSPAHQVPPHALQQHTKSREQQQQHLLVASSVLPQQHTIVRQQQLQQLQQPATGDCQYKISSSSSSMHPLHHHHQQQQEVAVW